MNVDTESKLLFKFGRLERVYVDYSPKNVTFLINVKFGITCMYMLSHVEIEIIFHVQVSVQEGLHRRY